MGGLVKGVLGGITGGGSSGAAEAGAAQNAADARTSGIELQNQARAKAQQAMMRIAEQNIAAIK
jgi:hypothetical protein